MSKVVSGLVAGGAAIFGFVAMAAVGASVGGPSRDMTASEILDKLAEAANEMKGEEVGRGVFVDHAVVEEDEHRTRLTYYYTVPDGRQGHIDRDAAQEAKQQIRRQACRDRAMRRAMDQGAVIRYFYRDPSGRELLNFFVSEGICTRLA